MQTVRTAQIQKCLVNGKRLNERRVLAHQIADLIAGLLIFLHVWPNNHGLRTQLFGLKHGHGRMHALYARNIATRGNNPAPPAADNERLIVQIWIVAFFDGGVKCVAIYMRYAQLEKFVMGNEAGRFAGSAALPVGSLVRVPQSRHNVCAPHLGGFSIRLGELPADPVISLVPDINSRCRAFGRPDELCQPRVGNKMNATNLRRMLGNAVDIMGNIVKKENRG